MLLDKVSITLCVGQMVAAMGENGTGTSTLLNVCAGDISSDIGCITLAGRALRHWRPIKRAKMRAVLPQETKLFFIFSAQEVVLMSRSAHCHSYPGPHDLAIAGEASQHFDVAHLADKRYPMLSGGARVRMMLARALAQAWEHWVGQSRALMLDEPIAALDLAHRHQALAAAKNFAREEGIAVLAVLHDVNVAAKYADHVTPLKHGTLFAAACTVDTNTVKNVESCFGIRMIGMKHPVHAHQLLVPA
jgi:iron complex transport system ATP-binding protein